MTWLVCVTLVHGLKQQNRKVLENKVKQPFDGLKSDQIFVRLQL